MAATYATELPLESGIITPQLLEGSEAGRRFMLDYLHNKEKKRQQQGEQKNEEEAGQRPVMTPAVLRAAALEHEGYETPALNDRLYLHYKVCGSRCDKGDQSTDGVPCVCWHKRNSSIRHSHITTRTPSLFPLRYQHTGLPAPHLPPGRLLRT